VVLIIRPHPKEKPDGLADIAAGCTHIRWHFDTECHPWALINRADLVCGMSSMFLIESAIMGTTTLSIQIGLCRENPFILDRRGILKSIGDEAELKNRLIRIIRDGERQSSVFEVIPDPVERIIAELETLLCHT